MKNRNERLLKLWKARQEAEGYDVSGVKTLEEAEHFFDKIPGGGGVIQEKGEAVIEDEPVIEDEEVTDDGSCDSDFADEPI